MSAYVPRTTAIGNLLNLSNIKGKHESLGIEFKVVADAATKMLYILKFREEQFNEGCRALQCASHDYYNIHHKN
eukprot:12892911-Ditylum_brightwellii.AAC.1